MAFQAYPRLLIGCARPMRPVPHRVLLTARGTVLVLPSKRQLHLQLQSCHVVTCFQNCAAKFPVWPIRCVVGPRRHYISGTGNGTNDSSTMGDSCDTNLINANSANANTDSANAVDSSDLIYREGKNAAAVNSNVLDNTSVGDVYMPSTEDVNRSGQDDLSDETKQMTSQDAWSTDDDPVVYTDRDFLTMRRQKRQNQEYWSGGVDVDHHQDEQDLQALLRNIQHQQEEQSRRTQREKRSSLMNVEELVEFLREENARDVCVIEVPPEMDYVDYFIVCSGMGSRHIGRMADHLASEVRLCVCVCDVSFCHYAVMLQGYASGKIIMRF